MEGLLIIITVLEIFKIEITRWFMMVEKENIKSKKFLSFYCDNTIKEKTVFIINRITLCMHYKYMSP